MYHSIDDKAPVIDGNIDTNEASYKKNYEDMTQVIDQLRSDLSTIKEGGGEKAAGGGRHQGAVRPATARP